MTVRVSPSDHDEKPGHRAKAAWPIISYETISTLLPIIDLAIILASSIVASYVVVAYDPSASGMNLSSLYGLGLVASGLYVFRMRDLDFYEAHVVRRGGIEYRLVLQTWAASILVLLALIYLFKLEQINTRRAFIVFLGLSLSWLIAWRGIAKFALRYGSDHSAIGRRNVLLIGEAEEFAAADIDELLDQFGVPNATRFVLPGGERGGLTASDKAMIDRAIAYAQTSGVEEVLVLNPWGDPARLNGLRDRLRALPVPARLLPDRTIRALTNYSDTGAAQIMQLELQRAPLTLTERAMKRSMDITLATMGLVVLSPLLLLVAAAIRLESPGPALFRQQRVGFNRRAFMIYKFRSMRVMEDGSSVAQAVPGDARVTRLGRFLRASSIDELPQLINVLKGEMSLVGPRPHATIHDQEFESSLADYAFRRHMKPGITGWAQCKGRRGPTPTVEHVRRRVELDLWYVTHWSISLDVYILIRTLFVVFGQKHAL
jgi:undecaprenyl-phosphate galactose phosphotransferase/putative colanic acid biosynthesis UDP-glucose lipid carrier transferase